MKTKRSIFLGIFVAILTAAFVLFSCKNTVEEDNLQDTLPPSVVSTSPAGNDTDVPVDSAISIVFVEEMDPTSITTDSFILSQDGVHVIGSVTVNGNTATLTPDSPLEKAKTLTATITSGSKDMEGNNLDMDYSWSFESTKHPTVTEVSPTDDSVNALLNSQIRATFSEEMDSSTITAETFTITDGSVSIVGTVSYADNTATFTPSENFSEATIFTATITTGANDLAGNPVKTDYYWNFNTAENIGDLIFSIGSISGNTTEGEGTASFTVKLNARPKAEVTIAVSSNDTAEGTVSPSSLTFTTANWNANQTVIVTGVDDTVVDGNPSYSIVLAVAVSSDSLYDGENPADVTVTNIDDDTADFIIGDISGNTTEMGGTATFTVKLNSQPTDDVTIGISSSNTSEGTVSPSSLTFTSSDWNIEQTVTVTGVDDAVADGDQDYTIVLAEATSSDSNYNGINPNDVSVTNMGGPGFLVGAISDNTTEEGGEATFSVKLTTQPTANVTIAVSSSDTSEGDVSPSSLTFTSTDWDTTQIVTVTGENDNLVDGTRPYTITLGTAVSDDPDYNGLDPEDVSVSNTDNDPLGFVISPISGNTTEAGGTATFTVMLDTQPTADVTIPLSSNDTGEGTVSPSSLTFTSINWDNAKTVTVSGVDDSSLDGNQSYTIILAASVSSDIDYNGIDPADVSVINNDNELPYFYDSSTGLMWQDNNYVTTRTWQNAISYCQDSGLADYTNWRLPNITELWGLYSDYSKMIQLNSDTGSLYWSSTEYDSSNAKTADASPTESFNLKTSYKNVRCVR